MMMCAISVQISAIPCTTATTVRKVSIWFSLWKKRPPSFLGQKAVSVLEIGFLRGGRFFFGIAFPRSNIMRSNIVLPRITMFIADFFTNFPAQISVWEAAPNNKRLIRIREMALSITSFILPRFLLRQPIMAVDLSDAVMHFPSFSQAVCARRVRSFLGDLGELENARPRTGLPVVNLPVRPDR
jgi:hypothetical protein